MKAAKQESRILFFTGAFTAEYQAILNYATLNGYTLPSTNTQVKDNNLIMNLKNAGVWDKLDIFQKHSTDGDSDFACINWKNPAIYNCIKVNSPVFTVNQGFKGNGSTAYLKIDAYDYSLSNQFLQNNNVEFFYVNNLSGGSGSQAIGGASTFTGNKANNNTFTYESAYNCQLSGSGGLFAPGITFNKLVANYRTDGISHHLYSNKNTYSLNEASVGRVTLTPYILAHNIDNSAINVTTSNYSRIYGIGADLSGYGYDNLQTMIELYL